MVYTDGYHLTADSLDELYQYANRTGLNPDWIDFGGRAIHPHFDICGHVKKRVMADVTVRKVTCKEIVQLCKINFRIGEDANEPQDANANRKNPLNLPLPTEADFERMIDNIFKRTGIRRR